MATASLLNLFSLLLATLLAISQTATSGDPNILSDFILPPDLPEPDESFFTYNATRGIFDTSSSSDPPPTTVKVTKVTVEEFPALTGQGVSFAVLHIPVGCTNPPHSHPRASEIVLVVRGCVWVGLVVGGGSDDDNRLYTQTLEVGDMFVFPKGLIHFQSNVGYEAVTAVSAYGSASAGHVSVPDSLFRSRIPDDVLADAFRTNFTVIQDIKAGFDQ